jgi:hypothetical protein
VYSSASPIAAFEQRDSSCGWRIDAYKRYFRAPEAQACPKRPFSCPKLPFFFLPPPSKKSLHRQFFGVGNSKKKKEKKKKGGA